MGRLLKGGGLLLNEEGDGIKRGEEMNVYALLFC